MTTTSADNGNSAGGGSGDGDSGDWSWFGAPRKDGQQPPAGAGQEPAAGEIPRRPVTRIRPVGSGAVRRATAEADGAAGAAPSGSGTGTARGTGTDMGTGTSAGTEAADRIPRPRPPVRPVPAERASAPTAAPGAVPPGERVRPQPTEPRSEEHQRATDTARPDPAWTEPEPQPQPQPAPDPAPALAVREPTSDAGLIRRTLDEVEPVADSATAYFYAMLFVQHPQLRDLFPASMDTQRDRIFKALLTAARLANDPPQLAEYLSGLGRGHRKYGTLPEHYPAVGECLIGALTRYATRTWSDAAEDAWVRAYTTISQIMIDAAAEDEQRAPAWWNAEVVGHETRTPGIAVVTLRPDQPYPFRAGQYTSLETPWWPRVWRHYSFASSPRSDGLLSFHVKAVPAGWVSSALVHRARPGDVVRLGPPAGSMTVDHSTDSGLLCLGGGTGIAPIKALIEDVAEHGRSRPVEVFYGARSGYDLYDLDTMLGLQSRHPWLSVRPVVSDGPAAVSGRATLPAGTEPPLAGQLPDVVRQYGPWSAYDGYLSGPPGMIRSALDALRGAGIPPHRIRHDSLEALVAAAE